MNASMTQEEIISTRLNKIIKANKDIDLSKPASLFDLRTIKPNHTGNTKYVNFGPLLGKKLYNIVLKDIEKEMGFSIDPVTYSRMCVEVSDIDNVQYIEISLNKLCQLPIAGSQYHILERDAEKQEMSIEGYVESLNFIINDTRRNNLM